MGFIVYLLHIANKNRLSMENSHTASDIMNGRFADMWKASITPEKYLKLFTAIKKTETKSIKLLERILWLTIPTKLQSR
jgi:hypothetical protein